MTYDVIVIGGGASGLTVAAVALSRGKTVLVLEAGERVGKKILLAGNGRCNVTNEHISVDRYNDPLVAPFLEKSEKVPAFFDAIGLVTRTIDGRIYPYTESGKTVLNLLRAVVPEKFVRTGVVVDGIERVGDVFRVCGETARSVVLATGSQATVGRESHFLYSPFGHTVRGLLPALCPLRCCRTDVKGLSGLRVKGALSLMDGDRVVERRLGEILFKEDGISGVVTLELSRKVFGKRDVAIDFVPDWSARETEAFLSEHSIEGVLQRPIAERVLAQSQRRNISVAETIKDYRVHSVERMGHKQAQVMQGGLPLGEFDDRLQSKFSPGLYACGEVLDVDGDCGGYNMHWAFLSGIIVGESV
ncbi:MAG: aminoacetone oxidase family FAD-binding enzyme [Clostridia bacterium]|nr:aminoacetone oxidase family FAD-binding enzyme [Clostridia bacterium]